MALQKLNLFLVASLLTISFAKTAHSMSCDEVLSTQTQNLSFSPAFPQDAFSLARTAREVENARKASEFYMSEMTAESNRIKGLNRNKTIELDWLCLGAGPQCAAASLVLGATSQKAMVLEKDSVVSRNFAEKDFAINSAETDNLSMHDFPGGVGSLSDLTSDKYAQSAQLAAYIQQQQFASNVPVLLGTEMTNVRVVQENGATMIEMTTNQNITIRTRQLLLGTGLGHVGTKVRDAAYRAAFLENYKKHLENPGVLFPVMSTDTVLIAIKQAALNGEKITLPRRIIIVGDGDGSRISIEAFRQSHVILPEGFTMTWIGNTFRTAEEYSASRNGWDRYVHNIIPFYLAGQISGIPGHVHSWTLQADGSMVMTTLIRETQESHQAIGDLVIDSTGYDSPVASILSMVGAQSTLLDVVGPLPELNLNSTVLARQAQQANGRGLPIFVIGPAAGALAKPEELSASPNRNSVSIFNTVPRTSIFLSRQLGVTPYSSQRGLRTSRGPVLSAERMIEQARERRQQQQRSSDAAENIRSAVSQ